MATLPEVMQALRNADAAGDTEGATKLAQIAQRLRSQGSAAAPAAPAQEQPKETTSSPLQGMAATAESMAGNFMEGIGRAGDYLQERLPLPTFGDESKGHFFQDTGNALEKAAEDRHYDPGKVMDQPTLAGKIGTAANLAVANAPQIAAALNPGTLAAGFIAQTNQNAEERARNDGRDEPTLGDAAAGGLGAAVQEALGRVGARAIVAPAARSGLARVGTAAATDAVTGAGGAAAQTLATQAGTQKGLSLEELGDNALEGGAVGLASGTGFRGAAEAAKGGKAAALERGDREARRLLDETPDQAQSDLRVGQLYETLRTSQEGTGASRTNDSVLFKKGMDRLKARAEDLVTALHRTGEISKDELDGLRYDPDAAIKQASQHNRELDLIDLDRVDRLQSLSDDGKSTLKTALRDLNTATANSLYKVRIGPAEEVANQIASPVSRIGLATLGVSTANPAGLIASMIPASVIRGVGRKVDDFTGARQPPVLRRLDALRKVAEERGLDVGDTMGQLETAVADARDRAGNVTLLSPRYLEQRARIVAGQEKTAAQRQQKADERAKGKADAAYKRDLLREIDDVLANHPDNRGPDREAIDFGKSQDRIGSVLRELRRDQEEAPQEDVRARVRAGLSPDAPVIGGPVQAAIDMIGKANIQATPADVLQAINRLAERGAIKPEELQSARSGERFPDLISVAREAALVAQDRGAALTPAQLQERAVQAMVQKAQVKAEAQRRLQAQEQQRLEEQQRNDLWALARFTPPQRLQEAVQGLQERKTKAAATRAANREKASQEAPQAQQTAPANVVDYGTAAAKSEGVKNPAAYAATLAHRDAALRTVLAAASGRPELQALVHDVEAVKTRAAKQSRVKKAQERFKDDPEALQWVREHLAVLSLIGGTKGAKSPAAKLKIVPQDTAAE